jgi:hypothetical protein
MASIKIELNIGIDGIKLGMTRDEVHEVIGKDYLSFNRGNSNIDAYYSGCLQVNYDAYYEVNFFEIASGICMYFDVFLNDVNVFETKAEELVKYIERFAEYGRDDWEVKLGHSYVFKGIGLSLWRSRVFRDEVVQEEWFKKLSQEQKDDEMKYRFFESVGIAVNGYWN